MNIYAKASRNTGKANKAVNTKPSKAIETAGSLAYLHQFDYFSNNVYDTFISSNPFIPNYASFANYSDIGGETVAYSGFMAGFANAVATIGTDCSGVSSGFCGGGFSAGGFGGGCSSGGSFSSFV